MKRRRVFSILTCLAIASILAGVLIASGAIKQSDLNQRLQLYVDNGFSDLQSMIDDFRGVQADGVMLIPPGMPNMLFGQGLRYAKWSGFPKDFVGGLVGTLQEGVTVYPVACFEAPKTRDYCFVNADGKVFYTVAAPADYNPLWILLSKYPDFYSQSRTYAEIKAMEEQYDPSRVVVQYKLIGKQELQDFLTAQIEKEKHIPILPLKMLLDGGSGGASVTNIKFTMMDTSSNGWMLLELSYPIDYTNDLEIFSVDGGTGLIDGWWTSRVVTNINSSTNYISWLDTTSSNVQTRFYTAANGTLNSLTDPDGDGLTWGQEKFLYKTDPEDPDTDGDGLDDYEEVINMNTDPNNPDTNMPSAVIAFPTNNFNWVWLP